MKYKLFFLLMISLFGCSKRTADCEILISDYAVYSGYGVINFSYSRTGEIRYIEFYPICTNNIECVERENITNSSFGEGIVIRENTNSKIWNTLIKDKSIIKNDEEYGKALIYIEFKSRWCGYVQRLIARICNPCPQRKDTKTTSKRCSFCLYLSLNLYANVN